MRLPDHEVHLWYLFADQIDERDLRTSCHTLLSEEEISQYRNLVFAKDRQRYLATRALVRSVLSTYTDVPPETWRFNKNEHGKPAIASPAEWSSLRFNLSHTGGLIVCGITPKFDIGVDVEDTSEPGADVQIAHCFFAPSERAYLQSLPAADQRDAFCTLWTLKEAYLKARGEGLSVPLDQFSFHLDHPPRIDFTPQIQDNPHDWQLAHFCLHHKYQLAVAIRRFSAGDLDVIIQASRLLFCKRDACTTDFVIVRALSSE